jgi:hypothetical protein
MPARTTPSMRDRPGVLPVLAVAATTVRYLLL